MCLECSAVESIRTLFSRAHRLEFDVKEPLFPADIIFVHGDPGLFLSLFKEPNANLARLCSVSSPSTR